MQRSEFRRWHAQATAVRTYFVVVAPPACDFQARIGQAGEPVFVQALVAERAVEALDVAVLHWTAWLDQQVDDLVLLRPGQKGSRSELWPVVNTE